MKAKSRGQPSTPELGTVVAIPLPDGRFAYAKLFRGSDLGVYDFVSATLSSLAEVSSRPILYHQFSTDEAILNGAWPAIGVDPFANEALSWGPPQAGGVYPGMDLDPVMLQIQHMGKLRRASVEEVQGLDIAWICQTPQQFMNILIQRLVNRDHRGRRVGA